MELSRGQKEMLRWFAAGHSVQMVAQYVDKDTRDVIKELAELEIDDRWQAERLLADASNVEQLEKIDDNLPNAGEEVPEFKQEMPNRDKLADYDKREIAKRGGNTIDLVPLAKQQAFRMDVRWRTLSELTKKWTTILGSEDNLKAAIKEFSPSAFKRLYNEEEEDAT